MDDCILVPLFQNEPFCETFHIKIGAHHMNGFAFTLVLTEAKCNSEMAYWMNVENVAE